MQRKGLNACARATCMGLSRCSRHGFESKSSGPMGPQWWVAASEGEIDASG